jgi:glycine cleavage system H protein
MSIPQHLRYTWDHAWLAVEDGHGTVGLTEFAANSVGDVVYVSLPEAGSRVEAGEPCGEIESPTAVGDLHAPASGEVTEINPALTADPGVVNAHPYTAGWLFRMHVEDVGGLLCAEAYAAHCARSQEDH